MPQGSGRSLAGAAPAAAVPGLQRQHSFLQENSTPIEEALADSTGEAMYLSLPKTDSVTVSSYRLDALKNCVFVGHTNTDMDSIGSALAAAVLFDGKAARASEVNGETKFVLDLLDMEAPPLFKTLDSSSKMRVCLVDHNQTTQMAEGVEESSVKGIIDHHALQKNTVRSDVPIIVDIKPWGSTCTMIARQFWKERRVIPQKIAGLLLAGILSDTLNLRSPTTTSVDKVMVSMLSKCTGMSDPQVNDFAMAMFKAKADAINDLSPYAMLLGDHKVFSLMDNEKEVIKLGFGVIETTYPESVLKRKTELLEELRAIRKEMQLDFSFAAIVDTLNLKSILLVCGPSETELAKRAFTKTQDLGDGLLGLGSLVSRKLDFIPALDTCLQQHDVELGKLAKKQTEDDQATDYGEVVVPCQEHAGCCMPTRKPPKLRNVVKSVKFVHRLKTNDSNFRVQAKPSASITRTGLFFGFVAAVAMALLRGK